tara:strand:+ start:74 stop:610 length:537 start_codon:yes stop_codon:yes gene_type:complete
MPGYKPFKMKGFSGFGEGTSPMKGYKSAAQRKAVHASKADGGKGNPNKMHKTMYNSPAKAAKPDYIDLDGDGNKTESMKKAAADKKAAPTKMYGKKSATKMKHGSGPKTERQANMDKERALNKRGSELGAKDPMRKKMFDGADKLGEERAKRNKAGKPMKMGHKSSPNKNYKKGYYGA